MTRMSPALFALLLTALPATAETLVTGPQGCALIAGQTGNPHEALDEEHMIFDGASLMAIEWHCAFESAFAPATSTEDVQIRVGYCMEPGPFIGPAVFTLLDRGDGNAQLDASTWTESLILEICAGS